MAVDWKHSKIEVKPYDAPSWTSGLKYVPQGRLQLAQLPTPIHRWNIPGLPTNVEVFIKRDDLTGNALSGNKIRKLEFILAEAMSRGCKHVITTGPSTSNHCRTTAVAAAQAGLKCHLILLPPTEDVHELSFEGNMFLNAMSGTEIHLVKEQFSFNDALLARQAVLAQKIENETGEKVFITPCGGSDTVGLFGYVEAFRELIEQGILDHITDIVFSCGSGGTAAGLVIANHLAANNSIRIHGIIVTGNSPQYFHDHINAELKSLGIDDVKSRDSLILIDDYLGEGYRLATQEDLDFICDVGRETGIFLDPTYNAKAARGLIEELKKNPNQFKGNKILYLHTGGLFGAMDHKELHSSLKKHCSGKHHIWDQKT